MPMPRSRVLVDSHTWCTLILALVLGSVLSAPVSAGAQPQRPAAYTRASLQGNYALVGIGDAHVAASVGVNTYDGQGGATGALTLNSPGTNQSRTIVKLTGVGTYVVNGDGTGTATMTYTRPDGTPFTENFDFVITQATSDPASAGRRATELFAIQREPGIAAQLVTFVLKRLPD
jgi:hypothetical protein